MITLILSGGLGNQMFQYAAAKSLAMRLDKPLVVDLYNLEKKSRATARTFSLDIFNINIREVSTLKSKLFVKAYPFIQNHRKFFFHFGFFCDTYALLFQPDFEKLSGNVIMSGHFQNEKYFKNIENEIRLNFSFKYPLINRNLFLSEKIAVTESVALHIRRGDYITNKEAASNFITCDKNYYEKAIDEIGNKIERPTFYIFSEDFEWVKENINFKDYEVYFIDWNRGEESYIDMQLMSICKHNIIANSSFSWWSAWLNSNENKIVVAPKKWFQEDKKNLLLNEFYPKEWIKR